MNYSRIKNTKFSYSVGWHQKIVQKMTRGRSLGDLIDVVKYVVIKERLMATLRKKWIDAKYYIECRVLYKARRPIDCIQPHLVTNMSIINSRRAVTLFRTWSHNLIDDEYHLLFTCFAFSAIHTSCDYILRRGDNFSVTL